MNNIYSESGSTRKEVYVVHFIDHVVFIHSRIYGFIMRQFVSMVRSQFTYKILEFIHMKLHIMKTTTHKKWTGG